MENFHKENLEACGEKLIINKSTYQQGWEYFSKRKVYWEKESKDENAKSEVIGGGLFSALIVNKQNYNRHGIMFIREEKKPISY